MSSRVNQSLGTLDEAHYPHCVGGVRAVPGAGPLRFGQQAAAFVVPQGLGVDLRLGGDLAGSHPTSMNPVPSYRVKPSSTSVVGCAHLAVGADSARGGVDTARPNEPDCDPFTTGRRRSR